MNQLSYQIIWYLPNDWASLKTRRTHSDTVSCPLVSNSSINNSAKLPNKLLIVCKYQGNRMSHKISLIWHLNSTALLPFCWNIAKFCCNNNWRHCLTWIIQGIITYCKIFLRFIFSNYTKATGKLVWAIIEGSDTQPSFSIKAPIFDTVSPKWSRKRSTARLTWFEDIGNMKWYQ